MKEEADLGSWLHSPASDIQFWRRVWAIRSPNKVKNFL